jgi:hypothetical protein
VGAAKRLNLCMFNSESVFDLPSLNKSQGKLNMIFWVPQVWIGLAANI